MLVWKWLHSFMVILRYHIKLENKGGGEGKVKNTRGTLNYIQKPFNKKNVRHDKVCLE